eukprot:Em0008g1080a
MDKRAVQEHAVFLCLLVVAVHLVISSCSSPTSWWNLSVSPLYVSSADPSTLDCSNSSFLGSPFARSVCAMDKNIVLAIARGTHSAVLQCQSQFGKMRWNCTTFLGQYLFGKFITQGTIESAAVYSFMAAGAAQELAVACRTGAVSNCKCETVGDVRTQDAQGNIIFNDCSDNTGYATDTMNQFIRDNSTNTSDLDLVNTHNYQVGLKMISQRNTTCLCHGVSGTCTVQTCYQQVPDVATIGGTLRQKYTNAVKVTRVSGTTTLRPVYSATLNESDLAYLADSPTFCTADNNMGILGTSGRQCNPTSLGLDSCFYLCCNRGYTAKTRIVPEECCQFVWCCRIECTVCRNNTVTDYFCN